jgi:hypothetical protein
MGAVGWAAAGDDLISFCASIVVVIGYWWFGWAVEIKKPTTVSSRGLASKFASATTNTRGVVSYNDQRQSDCLPVIQFHWNHSIGLAGLGQARIFLSNRAITPSK